MRQSSQREVVRTEGTPQGNFAAGQTIDAVVETILPIPLLIPALLRRALLPPESLRTNNPALVAAAVLVPFLSALVLLFLPLKDNQRDILDFVTLISSVPALPPRTTFSSFYTAIRHAQPILDSRQKSSRRRGTRRVFAK